MLCRSALAVSRRAAGSITSHSAASTRMLTISIQRREADKPPRTESSGHGEDTKHVKRFDDIKTMEDLLPPGAEPGTMPTDFEQATGLERLEILGKMQGVDVFDMRPLDASRLGTLTDPILVKSAGNEQFAGCTGCPADSHSTLWLGLSRARPMNRCNECGSVYMLEYVGPETTHHDHGHEEEHGGHGEEDSGYGGGHHEHVDPLTEKWEPIDNFSNYVKPEYKGVPKDFKNGHLL